MRKRWSSGGQDFCIVCACFVVVASACINASAQGHVVLTDSPAIATRVPSAAPTDLPDRAQARMENAKHHHFSHFPGYLHRLIPRPPVRLRKEDSGKGNSVEKKGADVRARIKQENIAREEIKKSADDAKQEARLIALDAPGITFEQRRVARDQAAEWRRQLRYQLVGNVVRQQRIDDGLEEAKRAAREQARKVAEEAKSLTIRE